MIDVHVLVMDYTPKAWVDQCFGSIMAASEHVSFPVAIHKVPGVVGDLGKARAVGYAQGTHPYVTHVDDDDYLEVGAFTCLAAAIEQGHDAITTGETLLWATGKAMHTPYTKHHLAVYRRDAIARVPYARFKYYPDQFLLSHFEPHHVPECAYVHRINHDSGSRAQRRENKAESDAELRMVGDHSLFYIELLSPAELAAQLDTIVGEA